MTVHTLTSGDEDGILISSAGNPADFQAAIGFAGLTVPDYLLEGPERDIIRIREIHTIWVSRF